MPIHPSAHVHPAARLADSVEVGPNVVIDEHVSIGPGTRVMANAVITGWTTLGANNVVHYGAVIGHVPQDIAYDGSETRVKVGDGNIFREYVLIHRGTKAGSSTVIGNNNMFMGYSHAAHNCVIGNGVTVANGSQLAGYVEVGDRAFISGSVMVHQFCRIGRLAMISGLSAINQDVPPFMTAGGRPCSVTGTNVVGMRRAKLPPEARDAIKAAYKTLYLRGLLTPEAVAQISSAEATPEVAEMIEFIKNSKKGIIHHYRHTVARGRASM